MRVVVVVLVVVLGCHRSHDDDRPPEDAAVVSDAPMPMCLDDAAPADLTFAEAPDVFLDECTCFLSELLVDPVLGCEVMAFAAASRLIIDGTDDPEATRRRVCADTAASCSRDDWTSAERRREVCETLLEVSRPCATFGEAHACYRSYLDFAGTGPSCSDVAAFNGPECTTFGAGGSCD